MAVHPSTQLPYILPVSFGTVRLAGIARMVDELDVRLNALQATSKATPDKPIETISEGDKKSG
jgi:hypothetical protein